MNDKKLIALKLAAVGFTLAYLYYIQRKSGGSMAGKYNPDSIAGLAAQLVPPEYRYHAAKVGSALLNRFIQ